MKSQPPSWPDFPEGANKGGEAKHQVQETGVEHVGQVRGRATLFSLRLTTRLTESPVPTFILRVDVSSTKTSSEMWTRRLWVREWTDTQPVSGCSSFLLLHNKLPHTYLLRKHHVSFMVSLRQESGCNFAGSPADRIQFFTCVGLLVACFFQAGRKISLGFLELL